MYNKQRINNWCINKMYDCSDCEFNKNHEKENCDDLYVGFMIGYKKAIDDFNEAMKQFLDDDFMTKQNRWNGNSFACIDEIGERLKKGSKNEN